MQARTRLWLLMIVLTTVISFLIGFQPIRRPPAPIAPEAAFEYRFGKPIAETKSEYDAKADEVLQALVAGGFNDEDIEEVTLLANDLVRVKTYALDEDQAKADEQKILEALKAKYTSVQMVGRVKQEDVEQPISELGGVLALYPPSPKVKLGLDLQGGLHVVLRCLPYASMAFVTSEEEGRAEPLYSAPANAAKPEATDADATKATEITRAELEKRVVTELVRARLAEPGTVEASAVSPHRLIVKTQAGDERLAKQQRSLVLRTLQDIYPNYKTINPPDDEFEVITIADDTADKVKNVIDRRLYAMGEIREPVIQKQGRDQIIVEIPGVKDPERVTSILKSTAMLEFRLIPQQYENASPGGEMYDEWRDKRSGQLVGWDRVLAESKAEFRGSDLVPTSKVVPGDGAGEWEVTFELKANRKRAFHEFTRKNVGRLMAIVLDDECQMAPVIKSPIPGEGVIEGNFGAEEAGDLRLLLNAGALPVPLEIAENRTVSATLGQDSIQRSVKAGMLGLLLVLAFMVIYYKLPGLLADIALLIYVLLVIAVMAASQSIKGVGGITLTLPGIAGIILSIGMAVDANVLIFERMKEELWAGKSLRAAVSAGFDRAWTAILDSNITTLIVTAVLYFLGTSLIKSFATVLAIGILCSLFSAVTMTRWLVTMVAESSLGRNLRLFGVERE